MRLNINSDAVVRYTARLERMHRSALPVAIRGTLNKAAFDVKTKTMPKTAKDSFIQRKPNFFKANSKVEQAQGFDVRSMKATIGFVPKGGDRAVKDLEQQEDGGKIGGRAFITTPKARAGGSWNKNVRADLRTKAIRKVVNAEKGKGSAKQRFVKAAIMAHKKSGKSAFVLGNTWGAGNQTLSRIGNITFNKKKRTIKINRTAVYTYKKNRSVKIAATNFMKRAGKESGLKMDKYFQEAARKQFQRLMR